MKETIYILIILFLLNSCNPRIFNLLEKDPAKMVSVYYLGKLYNLKKINDNSIYLKDSLLVSLKFFGVTNHIIEFNTKNINNQNFKLNLRNIFHAYNSDDGISIHVNNNHYEVYKNQELIKSGMIFDDKIYFYIENDGKYLKIKINCDDIYIKDLELYASEYLIIENMEGSSFELKGLIWENLQLSKKNH